MSAPRVTTVTMPVLGLTMEEGTVARWLKAEGDHVQRDEPLLLVEMDKGTVEVPAPATGVLRRIVVQPGQTVAVRSVIAEIGDLAAPTAEAATPNAGAGPAGASGQPLAADSTSAGQGIHASSPAIASGAAPPGEASTSSGFAPAPAAGAPAARSEALPSSPPFAPAAPPDTGAPPSPRQLAEASASDAPTSTVAAGNGGRRFVSPRARLRARELGVALERVVGSGPRGRVVEEDVLAAVHAPTAEPRTLATPVARRLALEHGVPLTEVQGTGPGGRITHEDVLRAAEQRLAHATAPDPSWTPPSGSEPAAAPAPAPLQTVGPSGPATAPAAEPGVEPLSRVRRITAERMAASAHSVARVTLFLEADLAEAARFRAQLAPELARLGVPKLPWDAILARAVGLALAEHPALNAAWVAGQGIRRFPAAHVGVAVALDPEGLVVPVLRHADTRSLRELAADLLALVDRARAGRLAPADMEGGTFTITNLGAQGVDGFTPIINPPQAAILGVGRITERPTVVDGRVEARIGCVLSLAFDHRVVDGAPAAAFLSRLAELLARPYALLGI